MDYLKLQAGFMFTPLFWSFIPQNAIFLIFLSNRLTNVLLLIIRNLLERPWRFNELKKNLEGVSQKVLTDSLRSMENDGLIIRTVYPEVPPRVEYSLSELGLTLKPILDSMVEWGNAYKKM